MKKKLENQAYQQLLEHFQRTLPGKLLRLQSLPLIPEIDLWLVDAELMHGPLSHEEAQAVVGEPAYWSFCWASGQVLARWILDHPAVVKGQRVLDFGAGSGVVAIAAALAGAREVAVFDSDKVAQLAARCNAFENNVTLKCAQEFPSAGAFDVIFAADILYDRENLDLLPLLAGITDDIILADSRIRNLSCEGYERFLQKEAITWPDLDELKEFGLVSLYRAKNPELSKRS